MKKIVVCCISFTLALTGCNKLNESVVDNHIVVTQRGGKTIAYCPASGVNILYEDGYAFKDLNRNGSIDVYEDWRRSASERAGKCA